jgi:glycosyltransferase involved in cell wall biosynthesis
MKIKIVRVVTDPYAVKYHMPNTLSRFDDCFDVSVVGKNVSQFAKEYPRIKFIDLNISRKVSLVDDFVALFSLIRFLQKEKPQIVHSLMPKAGLIAAIAGWVSRVPVRIHTFTGQVWATKTGLSRLFLKSMDWCVNKLNTLCLTDSLSQSQYLFDNGISFLGKPLKILSKGSLSGVDLARFNADILSKDAQALRDKLKLPADSFIFSYIARKTIDKGALDILLAFSDVRKLNKNAVLLFVGPDEDGVIEKTRNETPHLFDGVFDVGSVSNHELYLFISNALCLPSHREGFGSVVIDAAALGVATLGTKIPGLTDAVIDGETGLLSPLGDIVGFQKLMLTYIEDVSIAKRHGFNAKTRAHTYFSADFHYQELKKVYLELLSLR